MKKCTDGKQIIGVQVRMARAALDWTRQEAADAAGVARSTLQAIEGATGAGIGGGLPDTLDYRQTARRQALEAVYAAFTRAGVVFVSDGGAVGVLYQPKPVKRGR